MIHLVQSLGATNAKEMKRALESYSKATEKAIKDGELSGADAAPLRAASLAVARHVRLYNEALAQSATMAAVQRNTRSDRTAADNKKAAADKSETGKNAKKSPKEEATRTESEKTHVSEKFAFEDETSFVQGITTSDKKQLKSIGLKHVSDFDSNDIKVSEKWARIFWKELKEKSPFFRAWFGDWRAYSTDDVNKVTQKSDTRGVKKNQDTGWDINRSAKVSWENHNSAASISGKSFMPYIDGIIENAILLDSAISDKDNENSLFYHYLYAVVDNGSREHVIKLTVEEILNPGKDTIRRAYKLIDIEKYQPSAGVSPKLNSSQTTGIIKSIADLYQFVNTYDKNFKANPANEALLNKNGTPKVLYHQTSEDFEAFDTRHKGAGTNDDETPFGIFMKPHNQDIGLKGKKQLAVYAKISNPIVANDRADLVYQISKLSVKYVKLKKQLKVLNIEYQKKIDEAAQKWSDYAKEYRLKNPNATRSAIYDDAEFKKLYDAEDILTQEWIEEADKISLACKEEITATLKSNNYDGVILKNDVGSGGRKVETYIALDSTQVKSATENIGTFDSSNEKIKYSLADDKSSSDIVKAVLFSDRDVELSKAKAHLTQDRVFNKTEFLNTIRESTAERLSELIGIKVRNVSYDYETLENVARGLAVQFNKGMDEALLREMTYKGSELIADSMISVQVQSIVNEKGAEKVDAAYKAYNKIKSYKGRIEMSPDFKRALATAYGESTTLCVRTLTYEDFTYNDHPHCEWQWG